MKTKILILLLLVLLPLDSFCRERYVLNANKQLLERAFEIMHNQVGTTEASNRNDGEVAKYQKALGLPIGSKYCAAGIYWCFLQAAEELGISRNNIPIPKVALANKVVDYARKHGKRVPFEAKIYDLLVWRSGRTAFGHIEAIVGLEGKSWVRTIGFNTSYNGRTKTTEGVFYKRRNLFHPLWRMKIRALIGFEY